MPLSMMWVDRPSKNRTDRMTKQEKYDTCPDLALCLYLRWRYLAVQRRRRFSAEEKQRMAQETYQPGMTLSQVARANGVSPNLLFRWRKLAVLDPCRQWVRMKR